MRGRIAVLVLAMLCDPIACPDDATLENYEPFPNAGGVAQACQGGTSSNS